MHQKVTTCAYLLKRSRRRTLSVEVHPLGDVLVRSPQRTPIREIDAFLRGRADWILDRIRQVRAIHESLPPLTTPFSFHHRGQEMVWQGAQVSRDRWERAQAMEVMGSMIRDLLPPLGVSALRFRELNLRRMRRRWGSCSYSGRITLNTLLIRVPDHCARAVVAHELAHLVHMHHGPAFKRLVSELVPDYAAANRELDRWTCILDRRAESGERRAENGERRTENGERRTVELSC